MFGRVTFGVVWTWAMHFKIYPESGPKYCISENQRRLKFEPSAADQLQTITLTMEGSKWSLLILMIFMQDAMSEVLNMYPQLNMKVYVVDTKAHVGSNNKEIPRITMQVPEELPKKDGCKGSVR